MSIFSWDYGKISISSIITHTIFLADGAFLEPIANVFMRIIPEVFLKAIR